MCAACHDVTNALPIMNPLGKWAGAFPIERLRSPRGLSRARNVALSHLEAELVAFPDDDCVYPVDLLEQVSRRFATEPALDGLTGRAIDPLGRSSPSWAAAPARLTRDNLWNRAISFTIWRAAASCRPF